QSVLAGQLVSGLRVVCAEDSRHEVEHPRFGRFTERRLAGQVDYPQSLEDSRRPPCSVRVDWRRNYRFASRQAFSPIRACGCPGRRQSFVPPEATKRGGGAGAKRLATFSASSCAAAFFPAESFLAWKTGMSAFAASSLSFGSSSESFISAMRKSL